MTQPPICNYEGSDYQTTFWEEGGRAYEDQVEAVALRRLLPSEGKLMLELGAGAGRNTQRYRNFERVVLLDYSFTQMQQAQARLGKSDRYTYIAGDVYRLPFVDRLFDAATMIRVLHHLAEAPQALDEIRRVLQPGAIFILEFASKLNLKAILRYILRLQSWNPFTPESVEFVPLNFDFHPRTVRQWLHAADFQLERQLTLSHFRIGILKKLIPTKILVALDAMAQLTGDWWQLTPSVFTRSRAGDSSKGAAPEGFFRCPACGQTSLTESPDALHCTNCVRTWPIVDGIYDFRET
ncbi:MAG: methyltransferase domain-containing protein [Chloroflexi bacterium]|jgi:ubiquinone/menaquinone biosynthesis C-methylase UbiE|nr:methyltransferase domain-containing protein [Chloroflexota bacterium]